MSFSEDIAKVAAQVRQNMEKVSGEQATKQALILPLLMALGYDIYDPGEVIPEYTATFAQVGKSEKVDYGIAIGDTVIMLIEAKDRKQKAESHDGQLRKYFNALLSAKVGIVTNGLDYRFFTDLRDKNMMDADPFFSFNILDYGDKELENLKFFHKDNFDAGAIGNQAEEMVYMKGMTQLVGSILREPSEEFIRFLVGQINKTSPNAVAGVITKNVVKKFEPIVRNAIQASLVDLMTRSLSQGMQAPITAPDPDPDSYPDPGTQDDDPDSRVVTTADELAAFEKVKTIVTNSPAYRLEVKYKDVLSYFGLHLGNPNWWFLRLYLSSKKPNIVTRLPLADLQALVPSGFDVQEVSASIGGTASRVFIGSIDDIDTLEAMVLKCYEAEVVKH